METLFLLTPLREGRLKDHSTRLLFRRYFYSRPCGRGDLALLGKFGRWVSYFYSRPCGRGDLPSHVDHVLTFYFYSRPCGRGDTASAKSLMAAAFLLTPLREGRRSAHPKDPNNNRYFYSRPCGRGDPKRGPRCGGSINFYSRPCGRGDIAGRFFVNHASTISTHAPAGGATSAGRKRCVGGCISTHAPAGGATGWSVTLQARSLIFLLTPLREGRPVCVATVTTPRLFLLTPLREGRR